MLKPALFAAMFAGVMLSSPSIGHARLLASTPANDAQVLAPQTLTLSFSEAVELASLSLTSATTIVPVSLDTSVPGAKSVVVPIAALAPGRYLVKWTALSTDDGHVTKGSFSFTVAER